MHSSHQQIHGMAKLMWDLNWNVMEDGNEGRRQKVENKLVMQIQAACEKVTSMLSVSNCSGLKTYCVC